MAVPFAFDTTRALVRPRRLAAICHIFYVDLAEELLNYLSNLPHGTDVFISTTDQGKASAIQQIFSSWQQGRVEIRVAANRGRDIAPKLITFRDVYSAGYQLVLFLHSKKTEREDGLAWRKALLTTLAGSRETVASVLEIFDRNEALGMIIPQHHQLIRRHSGWQNNFLHARRLAKAMNFVLKTSYPLDFGAGSMFWLRPEALYPLLRSNLKLEDFPLENGQIGDTIAHAIERLMLFSCELAGYEWLKIADPRFFSYQNTILPINSSQALEQFTRSHGFTLLPSHLRGSLHS